MAVTIAEILAGPYEFYIGPEGEASPELDDLTPPAVTVTVGGNWVEVETMSDQTFNVGTPVQRVFGNKHLPPIKIIPTEESLKIGLTTLQNSLTQYNQAINRSTLSTQAAGMDQTAQDILKFGDKSGLMTIYSLLFVGTSPEGGDRVVLVHKAFQIDESEIVWTKEHRGIPIAWEAIADPSQAAGETVMKITDITAVATS